MTQGNHRWHRVSIQWTRKSKLQLVNIYGFDSRQEDCLGKNAALQEAIGKDLRGLGRAPWVIGGDWNMEPEQIRGTWEQGGEILRTGQHTHSHGKELDWFLCSERLPIVGVHQVQEQPFVGHHAIQMELQSSVAWDL